VAAHPFSIPRLPRSGGRRSAAARTGVSDCADLAPIKPKTTLALTALSFTPYHPHLASVSFLSPFRLFLSAGAQLKNKNRPATAEKEKTMKLEEIENKTNEAVSYQVAALESGQSDVLTQYLNAMARFHNYSFGNIMLIARQRAGT
jgi:hypothetical protein